LPRLVVLAIFVLSRRLSLAPERRDSCLGNFRVSWRLSLTLQSQLSDSCLVDFVLSWRLSLTHERSAVTRVLATFSHTLSLLPLSLARARVRARVLAGESALKK